MSGLEPLAAFGLACNVMQVISFAHEGVQVGKAIYESGCVDPNLAETTDCLTKGLVEFKRRLEVSNKPLNNDERELLEIARDCLDTASDLKVELDKIAGVEAKGKQLAAIRGWLRTVIGGKKKIEKIDKIMRSRREVLENRLLLRICNKNDAILIQHRTDFNELSSVLQGFVQACARGQTSLYELIRTESMSTKAHISGETNRLQQSLNARIITESDRVQDHVSSGFKELTLKDGEKQERETLLESLRYETMNARQNQIKSPHENTFQWIFSGKAENSSKPSSDENQDGDESLSSPEPPWDDFVGWLASEEKQPYWISGKAGSGKSTLMKFLIDDRRTKDALEILNPNTIILSHFLWALGQPLEREIKGILCSLVHQLLLKDPAIYSQILKRFPNTRHKRSPSDWSSEELTNVINDTFSSHTRHFCIFIDGLDEIDLRDGQAALIGLIDKLCAIPQVRMCVCSRPEPALQRRFGGCSKLRMQDLTKNDICRYAEEVLASYFIDDNETFQELVNNICAKAQGVFLWAALALRSIHAGLSNDDNIMEIQQRLEQLPDDLNSLYQEMWRRLNDSRTIYQKDAAQYFNLMLEYIEIHTCFLHMTVGFLTLAFNPSLAATVLEQETIPEGEISEACRRTSTHLQARCAGILEVSKDMVVTFIHRSAQEFLTGTSEGRRICQADQLFKQQCQLNLLRGRLGCVKLFKLLRMPHLRYFIFSGYYVGGYLGDTLWKVLHFVVAKNKLSAESLAEFFRLSKSLHEAGQWQYNSSVKFSPEFAVIAAFSGFLDQIEIERLISEAPQGMKLSSSYRDYVLGAACHGLIECLQVPCYEVESLRVILDILDTPIAPSNGHNYVGIDAAMRPARYYLSSNFVTDCVQMAVFAAHPLIPQLPRVLARLLDAGYNLSGRSVMTLSRLDHLSDVFALNRDWIGGARYPMTSEETLVFEVTSSFYLQFYLRWATRRTPLHPSFSNISSRVGGLNAPMRAKLLAVIPSITKYVRLAEAEVLIPLTNDSSEFTMEFPKENFFKNHPPNPKLCSLLRISPHLLCPTHELRRISDQAHRATLHDLEQTLLQAGYLKSPDEVMRIWPPRPYSPENSSD